MACPREVRTRQLRLGGPAIEEVSLTSRRARRAFACRSYHEVSLKTLNEMTRKYNIIAPYNVRRPLLTLANELKDAIKSCAPSIATELQRRLDHGMGTVTSRGLVIKDSGEIRSMTADDLGGEQEADKKDTMWRAFRRVLVEVFAKGPDEAPPLKRVSKE